MTFKEQVYKTCNNLLTQKIGSLQKTQADLKESASNETKSTAGDKHETALAMLQIEQKNIGVQLENLLAQKAVLDKLSADTKPLVVTLGALVKTNRGYLFISIPLGKMVVDGKSVIALSPQSPLGQKLVRLQTGETATVNGMTYLIENIE